MPFQSKKQAKFMFATMPQTAKKWAEHTPNMKELPLFKKKKYKKES